MKIELYVYDLTHGMARSMSRQLLGIQLDAVYHTAIVFDGIEYFFGQGVQTCYAGSTHFGRPMEIVQLGTCQLPKDVILEYLESLKEIYTPESYDLFAHNCNNFSNDFATFLIGKGVPEHITNLPQQVLDTPFGQMLRPQIDASMRSITQAPVPQQNMPPSQSTQIAQSASARSVQKGTNETRYGSVINVKSVDVLQRHIAGAKDTCTTIFFTSSTCAPCKIVYPTYDALAEEYPQALFLKADLDEAQEIATKYSVRATPSFLTLAPGSEPGQSWSGADPRLLRANVEGEIEKAFPAHPHTRLEVPKLKFGSMKPSTYQKNPPLDRLVAKLGDSGSIPHITALRTFIEKRQIDAKEASLPNLADVGLTYRTTILNVPVATRFAAVDLLRCALVDQRVSGYFAEEKDQATIAAVVAQTNELGEQCPHNLRLVTIHLVCNCFTSPLFSRQLLSSDNAVLQGIVQLITSSLLDNAHSTTRVAAASLAFNLVTANYRIRREESREGVGEGAQVELAASFLECLPQEDNDEAIKGLLLSLGYLLYFADPSGELLDLCRALDARRTILGSKHHPAIAQEVAKLI